MPIDPMFLLLDGYPGETCTNVYKETYLETIIPSPFGNIKNASVCTRLERKKINATIYIEWDAI